MWRWTIRKAKYRRIDAFRLWSWRRLESTLDCKSKQINPKGNQPWIFFGRTDADTEGPILWLTYCKRPWCGKDWRQKEKRVAEDEMVRWHHQLNGHDFKQTSGDSEGQGCLACCRPWDHRVRHDLATEQQPCSLPQQWELSSFQKLWYFAQFTTHFLKIKFKADCSIKIS